MDRISTSPEEGPATQTVRPLWRNVDFMLLWSGQLISILGTNVSGLALPLLILALTHSPAQAGLFAAVRQLPYLLISLPAGALIDRWDRKRTMICCDLLRWLALGSVPLAFALGHLTLLQLYLVALFEGSAYVLFSLAQISALPHVVAPHQLPRAYALDTTIEYTGTLLGPGLGAFIIGLAPVVQVGAIIGYLVDSVSYLLSGLSLLRVRASFQVARADQETPRRLYHGIAEGLRFLWRHRALRLLALLTALVNFLLSPLELALIIRAQSQLHLSVQFVGLIFSVGGVGGILGGLLAPWLHARLRGGQILCAALIIWIGAALLLALSSWPGSLLIGKFLFSFSWPPYGVTVVAYRLRQTPDALQGRVNSAFRNLTYGSEPLGSALGGLLLVALDARIVFGLITAGLAAALLLAIFTRLRRI
ncbi:MFS transporter [Dictyobacter sp. S3.2.2.5]|uniref:MFS transporter n=1 Tax=Dictyobacter halimunensis TaxID=3026934 RepID=A0ABQ6G291_9CHLR|nr:MFS transporter [Dictyobacter sp. S3.2.2.5]